MASGVWTWSLKLCIFTPFLHLCVTQTANMRNVARNKTCGLSSQYTYTEGSNKQQNYTGNCSAAINGNNNTNFELKSSPPNCIHTAENDQTQFWWVNLGQGFVVTRITIFGRNKLISRMVCVNVSVDGQLVKRFTDTSGWNNDTYDVTVGREGRVINITRDCSNDGGRKTINICEVQVWECVDGRYGDNCTQTCGNCAEGPVCDKANGTCKSCISGFQTPLCEACASGFYGENCTQTCGRCANNSVCDKVNGSCVSCEAGFQPPLCKESAESNGTPVGAIFGFVMAAIVVTVVVVIVILVVSRRRQEKGPPNERMTGTANRPESTTASEVMTNVRPEQGGKPIAQVKPQTSPNSSETYEVNDCQVYGNVSTNTQTSQQMSAEDTNQSVSSNGGKVEGRSKLTDALAQKPVLPKHDPQDARLYANVNLKANMSSISDASQSKGSPAKPSEEEVEEVNLADDESDNIYNTDDVYASYRSMGPSSILDEFQKCLLASLASGKLGMEFAEFPKSMEYPHETGSRPENSKKNRFRSLFAYDHSRVVLRRPKGDNNTDYINANYIRGCHGEKAYIATQGPRVNTVDDLWWMVWQENATQIVMLTNIKEGGKDKCEEYWPSVGETKTYGHVTVTALSTDTRAHFVVRNFLLSAQKVGDQREVNQFHYLAWPDHGVPSSSSLVNFWRYVKARATGAMPVVHCSAGVGRTGTYIGLDIACDLSLSGRDANVKDIVTRLRQDRTLMVQTEEQYKFLHEVILEEYRSRATRMTLEQFDVVFPDTISGPKARIEKEFKFLKLMGDFVPKPNHTIATSKENMSKNRNTDSLPEDSLLVYLTEYIPGKNQYINAVYMSSFRKKDGLILTQLPLPDTVVDMWRMVDGCGVNTIVSIGHKDQRASITNYCAYWPETENDVLKTEQYAISLTSKSALGDHITCYILYLTKKVSNSREVRVLYYDDWEGVVPGRISDILQLTDTLESWHVEEDRSPVVVQCSDGVERSGMFCVLYDVINRVRHDEEIDIYIPVRQVQRVRRQAVTSEEQYRYCYKVAQWCKRQHSVYQNT